MKELYVIVDVSGSMYAMGKPLIVGNILQTLSACEKMADETNRFTVEKIQWDGSANEFESLIEKCNEKKTLLLTDGYSLADSCSKSRVIKDFIEKSKKSLYLVLCGGDAVDVSAYKDFSSLNVVLAENVLKTVETLMRQEKGSAEEEGW
jgi:hypothetical protein